MGSFAQRGQALTDWVLVIAFIGLSALAGFVVLGQQTGAQGAQLAATMAGNVASVAEDSGATRGTGAEGDSSGSSHGPGEYPEAPSALDYAKGLLSGIYQNLLDELGVFTSPLETLAALYSLGVMLAEDASSTAQALLDSLLIEPLDQLVNGTPFEQGFVVGQQISPAKALSVVSKIAAIGAVVAPAKRLSNQVVIGHGFPVQGHPTYIELADELGARYFHVPAEAWDRMSVDQRIDANLAFLDRAIERGDEIILSTPAGLAEKGSFYDRELKYLALHGYEPSDDGLRLIKPGGN